MDEKVKVILGVLSGALVGAGAAAPGIWGPLLGGLGRLTGLADDLVRSRGFDEAIAELEEVAKRNPRTVTREDIRAQAQLVLDDLRSKGLTDDEIVERFEGLRK